MYIVWWENWLGAFHRERPTYVYPVELKALILAPLPGDVQDRPDPSGPLVCITEYALAKVGLSPTLQLLIALATGAR